MGIKINVDADITDFDGKPFTYPQAGEWETVMQMVEECIAAFDADGKPKVDILPALRGLQKELRKPLTYHTAMLRAMLSEFDKEKDQPAEKKFERVKLAEKIHCGGEIDLDTKEAAQIDERCSKLWPVLIAYRVHQMIEGD